MKPILIVILFLLAILLIMINNLSPRCLDCNVIIISIDTLRADHLGTYGYEKNTSSNIDEFAKKSNVFENAYSQGAYTLTSHMSLLTSTYPSVNKIGYYNDEIHVLNSNISTIAEVLKKNGYKTFAFVDGVYLLSNYDFDKGFDYFDEQSLTRQFNLKKTDSFSRIKNINPRAIDILTNSSNEKFFLFLHYMDVHEPEESSPYDTLFYPKNYSGKLTRADLNIGKLRRMNLSGEDIQFWISQYDAKIKNVDVELGKFLSRLESLNLMNNTIIIILSDHGEEFGEHGDYGHGRDIYEESVRVPLIFYVPKTKPNKIYDVVGLVDVFPSVLEILGIKKEGLIQGSSLFDKHDFAFTEHDFFTGIRKGKYSLIINQKNGSLEIYDNSIDRNQRNNLKGKVLEESFLKSLLFQTNKTNEKISKTIGTFEMENKTLYPIFFAPILQDIPIENQTIISDNPFLIFDNKSNIQNLKHKWFGNSYYEPKVNLSKLNAEGVVMMHPKSIVESTFLAQDILLPNKTPLVLKARIANLADLILVSNQCRDSLVRITVIDKKTNNSQLLYEDVVVSIDPWKNVSLDISSFAGMNITIKAEGMAGGFCGLMIGDRIWNYEFSAIDEFYVFTTNQSIDVLHIPKVYIIDILRRQGYIS